MKKQGYGSPRKKFRKKKTAYSYGVQKWGSGSYNSRSGWKIKEC